MSQSQQATVSSLSPCGNAVVTWKVLGVGITGQFVFFSGQNVTLLLRCATTQRLTVAEMAFCRH